MATHTETYQDFEIKITFTTAFTYRITIAGVRIGGTYQNQGSAIAAAYGEVDSIWELVASVG